jgi:selenocysteine-specific elongation factor
MRLVVGTAGHIDHGKTTLLRALTGIDADRLPEERRRGMTIDVGYAHMTLADGVEIDFVDVPGHDRLVGNMLVGAGEIDAVMLVVAADDGPRAQTLEHLALLDALGVSRGFAVVTKVDSVPPERADEVVANVRDLLEPTALAGSRVVAASGTTGEGLDAVRAALGSLAAVADTVTHASRPPSLAIDRVFSVKGRGTVVTGSLRGGPLARGDRLRVVPGGDHVRIREIQVHGHAVEHLAGGGRTALNLVGDDLGALHRGVVLTADPDVVATDRILVALRRTVPDRSRARLHLGTAAVDAAVGRSGRDGVELPDGSLSAIVRLAAPIAVRVTDRFVLRRGPELPPVGGLVLDARPPTGLSRRRQTRERLAALVGGDGSARLDLHGAVLTGGLVELAPDIRAAAAAAAVEAVGKSGGEVGLASLRAPVAAVLRRHVTVHREAASIAAADVIEHLVMSGALVRDGDSVRLPGRVTPVIDPGVALAMDRLEAALAVPAPPSLAASARATGCPPAAVRDLERTGRIVVIAPDLAYTGTAYGKIMATALAMARAEPLSPAALRDATGTSRKYVMAVLEDLDRRGILRRTPAGHVPGPRAAAEPGARG